MDNIADDQLMVFIQPSDTDDTMKRITIIQESTSSRVVKILPADIAQGIYNAFQQVLEIPA